MPHLTQLLRRSGWLTAILLLPCPNLAADEVTCTFDADDEGWTVSGNASGPVIWIASGGNPDGGIKVNDSVVGGVMYFTAPAIFHGDRSCSYGLALTFDLKQTITGSPNQFNTVDLYLGGGGITVAYDLSQNPPIGSWGSFQVPLVETGWRIGSLSGAPATKENMMQVLGSLSDLRIRAEYQTGGDTDYLDNVVFPLGPSPDLNADGHVDAADLALLLGAWGTPSPGDLTCDGVVAADDLAVLLGAWTG